MRSYINAVLYGNAEDGFCVKLVFAGSLSCGKDNFTYSVPSNSFFARAVGTLKLGLKKCIQE